jgi:copper chaperone CopZ
LLDFCGLLCASTWLIGPFCGFTVIYSTKLSFKKMKKAIFVAIMFMMAIVHTQAQTTKVETTTFWVAGICGRCETTIESAMDTKGVISADYDLEKEMLTITYKTRKISIDQIHQKLNDVGYDTAISKCSDEQYARVHHCCKYREQAKH